MSEEKSGTQGSEKPVILLFKDFFNDANLHFFGPSCVVRPQV